MTVPVPTNLRDFQIELGKTIEAYGFQVLGMSVPAGIVQYTSDQQYVNIAIRWCNDYRPELQGLAKVVHRAQIRGEGAQNSLMSDLGSDIDGVMTFLRSPEASYIGSAFVAGTLQADQKKLHDFLKLVQELIASR